MGHITVDLRVGPIRSPTRFYMIDVDALYHLFLGRFWINKNNCVPSTVHQCIKACIQGKNISILKEYHDLGQKEEKIDIFNGLPKSTIHPE